MSSPPIAPATAGSSTRPYLIRALHDWCTDNGFTPYVAVFVDGTVQVPIEYVKNNEIVLNVGFEATSALKLGNELIEFKARFGGTSREIAVPIDHVIAIYAREAEAFDDEEITLLTELVADIAYGSFRFNKAENKAEIVDIVRYPAECVNPPANMTSTAWLEAGMPGAKCN